MRFRFSASQQIFDILFRQRIAGDDFVKGKTACVKVILLPVFAGVEFA